MRRSRIIGFFATALGKALCVSLAVFVCMSGLSALPAHACSCTSFFEWGFFGGENGTLPANAIGIGVYAIDIEPDSGITGTIDFTVERLVEGGFQRLPERVIFVEDFGGVYVVAPQEGLKPGSTYRFTGNSMAGDRGSDEGRDKQVTVTVSPAELSAKTAFTLDIGPVTTEHIRVAAGVSCVGGLEVAYADVEAVLGEEAQQWREQLMYRTIVDDEFIWWNDGGSMCSNVLPGRSGRATGHDRIFAACGPVAEHFYVPELKLGMHTVKMQAFLPGTGVVLETAAQPVNLDCRFSPFERIRRWLLSLRSQ